MLKIGVEVSYKLGVSIPAFFDHSRLSWSSAYCFFDCLIFLHHSFSPVKINLIHTKSIVWLSADRESKETLHVCMLHQHRSLFQYRCSLVAHVAGPSVSARNFNTTDCYNETLTSLSCNTYGNRARVTMEYGQQWYEAYE